MQRLYITVIALAGWSFSIGQELNEIIKQDIFGHPSNVQNQMYINMMNHGEALKEAGETSLYDEWQPAKIRGQGEVVLTVDSANYNYATDQFYFVYQGRMYYLDSRKVQSVEVGTARFGKYTFSEKKDLQSGFMEVLVAGDFPLLKRVYWQKTIVNDHPMKIAQANRTVTGKAADLFYLNPKTGTAEKLPRSKRKFIQLFRKRQARLIRFAEENNISTHHEPDIIRFFAYNQLINSEQKQ